MVVRDLRQEHRDVQGSAAAPRQPFVGDQGTIVHAGDQWTRTVECVDASGYTTWLADFHIDELAPALPAWSFDVREVSPNAYCATGCGPRGMRVESTDSDPDKALADCRAFALRYPT